MQRHQHPSPDPAGGLTATGLDSGGKTSCVWRSPVTRHDASSSTKTEISRLSSHVRRNVSGLLFLFEAVRCRFATMSASILVEGAHSGNLIQKETSLRVLPALGLASVPPILFINKPCLLQQARESPPKSRKPKTSSKKLVPCC